MYFYHANKWQNKWAKKLTMNFTYCQYWLSPYSSSINRYKS